MKTSMNVNRVNLVCYNKNGKYKSYINIIFTLFNNILSLFRLLMRI